MSAQTNIITTVAGMVGARGFSGDGGPATQATMNQPYGMAVDAAGNIYIADTLNQRIRKVTKATGVMSTIAGNGVQGFGGDNGPATAASLSEPTGVAVDAAGNVYISDQKNNRIRKVTTNGIITTIVGNGNVDLAGDGGPALAAGMCHPFMVTVDGSGNLYISDTGNHAIRKVTAATGKISTVAGQGVARCGFAGGFGGDGGNAKSALLNAPNGVTLDAAGNIYIGDLDNHRIRKVTVSTGIITTVAGTGNTAYNGDGIQATAAGLNWPYMAALDSAGNLYIPDYLHYRIRKVTVSTGLISTVAGNGSSGFDGDGGPATDSYISDPTGVAVDTSDNFYIVDQFSHRIRKVAPAGPPPTSAPPAVTANPADQYAAPGGVVGFAASASGTPAPTMQWQISTDNGASFANLAGATGSIYSFGVTLQDNGKKFRAVFTNATGTATTTAATLIVRPSAAVPRTDFDGDRIGDLTVWRPGSGTWYTLSSSSGYASGLSSMQWGNQSAGDVPMMGDLDGDGIADPVIWRPGSGTFFWLTSTTGYTYASQKQKQWGSSALGDVPMLGDMDGDGRMDLILWRASNGTWFWLTSSSGYSYGSQMSAQWGNQSLGDIPMVGDVDGDGRSDPIVWRASVGTFFWLTSSSGYSYSAQGQKHLGTTGDVPMVGDLDGDGKVDLVVWRPSNGTWYWLTSTTSYNQSYGLPWGNQSLGDVPLLTDLDGDGRMDLVVWRASNGTWFWLKSTAGYDYASQAARQWGSKSQGDIPIVR